MAFQNVNYQPIQSDNEELGEDLPPTVVTTRGSENSGRSEFILSYKLYSSKHFISIVCDSTGS